MIRRGGVAVLFLALVSATAQADIVDDVTARARRAIALGPTLGTSLSFEPSPGEFDGSISFGFALFTFEPKLGINGERIESFVAARLVEYGPRIRELSVGDLLRLKQQIEAEARAQLHPEQELVPHPRFGVALEGGATFAHGGGWFGRASAGIGVGKVTIGPTLVVRHIPDATTFGLGPEVAVHLLFGDGARPPALQIFLRADFFVAERDAFADSISLGARFLIDLI